MYQGKSMVKNDLLYMIHGVYQKSFAMSFHLRQIQPLHQGQSVQNTYYMVRFQPSGHQETSSPLSRNDESYPHTLLQVHLQTFVENPSNLKIPYLGFEKVNYNTLYQLNPLDEAYIPFLFQTLLMPTGYLLHYSQTNQHISPFSYH